MPRHLAIGDIHGCYRALTTLAELVEFRKDDLIVTLGDYVDRGPNTRQVLDWLMETSKTHNLVPLRGNHEIMMVDALGGGAFMHQWLSCGGDKVLQSYGDSGKAGELADVPDEHWEFLSQCRRWHETDTHFFVHANALPDMPLDDQPDYMLFWEFFHYPPPHDSGKTMICGHSSQKSGLPKSVGHAVCIDTWACGSGWLTCLDCQTGEYWQANERGQTRSGWLSDTP